MSYLVDADILSEPTRPSPDGRVVCWLRAHEHELFVNPIILGELEYGILQLPAGRRRTRLESWFSSGVQNLRSLDFDTATAHEWAMLLSKLKRQGRSMPVKDSLIAATAIVHKITVATRNVKDFSQAGISVVNPFES